MDDLDGGKTKLGMIQCHIMLDLRQDNI